MPILRRWYTTLGLIAIVIWLGYRGFQIHDQRVQVAAQVADLQNREKDAERNNQFLASSSAYFNSDAYLERQARLKLNYKLPDEKVAFVYPDTSVKTSSTSRKFDPRAANIPNWKKWWYYLLGY